MTHKKIKKTKKKKKKNPPKKPPKKKFERLHEDTNNTRQIKYQN